MEITNFDVESKRKSQHHWLLPDSIYAALAVDPVLVEKTNLMLNLLKGGYFNYDRLHIYSKTLGGEKYQFLRDSTEVIEQFANRLVG